MAQGRANNRPSPTLPGFNEVEVVRGRGELMRGRGGEVRGRESRETHTFTPSTAIYSEALRSIMSVG